jgi:NADPH:quinone reductase-like Zn-dependent oxidoreductase
VKAITASIPHKTSRFTKAFSTTAHFKNPLLQSAHWPVRPLWCSIRALHKEVCPLIESGRVRPVIQATFPLALAAEAQRLMETGSHIGKIVLEVGSSQS